MTEHPKTTGRNRAVNVGTYSLICLVLLVVASAAGGSENNQALVPIALVGAAVMFGFALWSAWRR